MTTKLTAPIKREISIDGQPYVVTISLAGVLITKKRARSGTALTWKQAAGIDPITAAATK